MGEFPNKSTQFSGEPGPGRPVGSVNMRTLLKEMLADGRLGDAGELWLAQWKKATLDGDTTAAKFLVDNLEGLLTQKVEQVIKDDEFLASVIEAAVELGVDRVKLLDRVQELRGVK